MRLKPLVAKQVLNKVVSRMGYEVRRKRANALIRYQHLIRPIGHFTKINPAAFLDVMSKTRSSLLKIETWMTPDSYENSFFQYGMPHGSSSVENIEFNPTYTDLMLFLSQFLAKPIDYLEIGVSAGKNFYQLAHYLQHATLTGLDIEEINPILEAQFQSPELLVSWENLQPFKTYLGNLQVKQSSLRRYQLVAQQNLIYYLSADEFSERTWQQLEGHHFNMIFSDAYHDPSTLGYELSMWNKFNLLDPDELIIVWDDLGRDAMLEAFISVTDSLMQQFSLPTNSRSILQIHGTYGYLNHTQNVGLLCTLPEVLKNLSQDAA